MIGSLIQPYFVLSTKKYYKAIMNNYGISHFYTFKKDELESNDTIAVPDGCVDILFTYDGISASADICGSVLEPKKVLCESSSSYFGVRFYPGECFINDNINIKEIIGNMISLKDIPNTKDLIEKIATSKDFTMQVSVFLEFYTKQLAKFEIPSDVLHLKDYMFKRIIKSNGQVKVKELAYEIGYSERYTNQKFIKFFGMPPKVFSKIIRFQHVLNQLNQFNCHLDHGNLIDIAQDSGYYDQSHMYKDFNEFSNNSPGQYIDLLKQKDYYKRLIVV